MNKTAILAVIVMVIIAAVTIAITQSLIPALSPLSPSSVMGNNSIISNSSSQPQDDNNNNTTGQEQPQQGGGGGNWQRIEEITRYYWFGPERNDWFFVVIFSYSFILTGRDSKIIPVWWFFAKRSWHVPLKSLPLP
jgi:hypothetical protein